MASRRVDAAINCVKRGIGFGVFGQKFQFFDQVTHKNLLNQEIKKNRENLPFVVVIRTAIEPDKDISPSAGTISRFPTPTLPGGQVIIRTHQQVPIVTKTPATRFTLNSNILVIAASLVGRKTGGFDRAGVYICDHTVAVSTGTATAVHGLQVSRIGIATLLKLA